MSDLAAYLEAEFRRTFSSSDVTIDIDSVEETITVIVVTPTGEANHFRQTSFTCELGSDDDFYEFVDSDGRVLNLPLMPES